MRRWTRYAALAALVVVLAALAGCAAGSPRFMEEPAGFWMGMWHGLIIIIAFIVSLFDHTVHIYEANNNGAWYDFGFIIGLLISVGGCVGGRRKKRRRRKTDEWDEIGEKVEKRVRKGIDRWLEEKGERDDEWEEIGKKIEEKIRRELKDWADK